MADKVAHSDGFEAARRKRAASPKFRRICELSLQWQSALDAARHQRKLDAMHGVIGTIPVSPRSALGHAGVSALVLRERGHG